MRPCQSVNQIILWGQAKDTTAKISIMQNQFPCNNPNKFIGAITGLIMEVVLLGEWRIKIFWNAQYQLANKLITTAFYFECIHPWVSFIDQHLKHCNFLVLIIRLYDIFLRFHAFLYIRFWFLQPKIFHSIKHLTCACMWSSEISLLSQIS